MDSSCNRRQTMTLIQAGSRFLTDAESRYAIIELELLAISWAIIKCKMFLADLPHFRVITDHHPLIPILNSHRLDEIENPWLQRLDPNHGLQFHSRMAQRKENDALDVPSRNPVLDPQPQDTIAECDIG